MNKFRIARRLIVWFMSLWDDNWWYSYRYDRWFPKCRNCYGERTWKCPVDCEGDR